MKFRLAQTHYHEVILELHAQAVVVVLRHSKMTYTHGRENSQAWTRTKYANKSSRPSFPNTAESLKGISYTFSP